MRAGRFLARTARRLHATDQEGTYLDLLVGLENLVGPENLVDLENLVCLEDLGRPLGAFQDLTQAQEKRRLTPFRA